MFNLFVFNDKYRYRNRYHKLSNVLNIYVTFKNLQSKTNVCDLCCKQTSIASSDTKSYYKKNHFIV